MTLNLERELPIDDAIALGCETARAMGATLEFRSFGASLQTTECVLTDRDGWSAIGTGKGLHRQTRASAIFESLEHYYYNKDLDFVGDLKARPLNFAQRDNYLLDASPRFSLFAGLEELPVTRTRFVSLSGESDIEYPTFLTHPRFVSSLPLEEAWLTRVRARRYSTNSGVASGATRDEAVLHGLLELVERDALGLELLATIFARIPADRRCIDRLTMPNEVRQVLQTLEQETGGIVTIWNVSSDINVSVILARLQVSEKPGDCFFGSGASLDPEHAIRRATLEALQGFHVFTFIRSRPLVPQPVVAGRPTNYRRALLECGVFEHRGAVKICSFEDLPHSRVEGEALSPRAQVAAILELLRIAGVAAYTRDIFTGKISVVHTLAPQLERFFLVSVGLIIAPGGRGARLLRTQSRADRTQPS